MDNTLLVVVILAAIVVIALVVLTQRQRSEKLRDRFGPEYDHTVDELGNKRRAEEELAARQKRVESLNIRTLTPDERNRFAEDWRAVQAKFVDDPAGAMVDADQLVKEVMETRGYPMGDFDQRAADISVDHPDVVMHYRAAREIAVQSKNGKANTEQLRQALVHYRALFEDLLGEAEQPVERTKEAIR